MKEAQEVLDQVTESREMALLNDKKCWTNGDYRPMKIVYNRRVEICGETSLTCPFCIFWCEGENEERMLLHLKMEHVVFNMKHVRFSSREVGDCANDHRRFPSMLGTHCRDSDLLSMLKECHKLSNTSKSINIFSVSAEARERGIHLFFCGFCGQKTLPDKTAQISHVFSEHIQICNVTIKSRNFFTL
jgi:hypothetical protein